MQRTRSLRISSFTRGILLAASLSGCGAGSIVASPPGSTPGAAGGQTAAGSSAGAKVVDGPLALQSADAKQGVAATWDDGTHQLELSAFVDAQGIVQSTISSNGHVITRLAIPFAKTADLSAKIGPLALAASKDAKLIPASPAAEAQLKQLLPVYAQALTSLFRLTDSLGDNSLHMALPWHEEVLARLVVGPVAETDPEAPCPDIGIVHTKLMHAPELTALMQGATYKASGSGAGVATASCNLGCSWYDVCCLHDQACVNCDHWWCGWCCVPGCFGGECGCGG
jgi:hypothetical protein